MTTTITTLDTGPYDDSRPGLDGRGKAYIALLDVCPETVQTQFALISEPGVVDVDLPSGKQHEVVVGYTFQDPAYGTKIDEGATAVLSGFLDDDGSSEGATNPSPGLDDTIFQCIDFTAKRGKVNLAQPLVPCLLVTAPDPYLFDQGGFADCSGFGS